MIRSLPSVVLIWLEKKLFRHSLDSSAGLSFVRFKLLKKSEAGEAAWDIFTKG